MNYNPYGTTLYTPDGDEVQLPTKWEICQRCAGEGYTVLHGMEINPDDWEQEELDEYFHGSTYRTPCDCDGTGKVKIVDEDRLSPTELGWWNAQCADVSSMLAMEAQERAMGA